MTDETPPTMDEAWATIHADMGAVVGGVRERLGYVPSEQLEGESDADYRGRLLREHHARTAEPESEKTLEEVAARVTKAVEVMRTIAHTSGFSVWTARELQDRTARVGQWSSAVASLAFWRLVDDGELVVGNDLRVTVALSKAGH